MAKRFFTPIQFDTSSTAIPSEGQVNWDATAGTIQVGLKGGAVTLQVGQEEVTLVKHADNTGLTKGKAVYFVGSDGSNLTVRYAQAIADSTSATIFGVMTENAIGGSKGYCATFGVVRDIDTSALTEGHVVYLSPTTAGELTTTKPVAPDHLVQVGYCLRSHATVGALFVNVQNGYELEELHNVLVSGLADNNVLAYDSTSSLWKNQTAIEAGLIDTSATSQTKSGNLTLSSDLNIAGKEKFSNTGTGTPTFTTYSAGTRSVLYDNIGATSVGYTTGIAAGTMWQSIPAADAGQYFKWYGGETQLASLSGAGHLTTTGEVTASKLIATSPGGDEGGEINLALAVTNTTLVGGVVIDVNQNRLRIFEQGGTNRGVYIDISGTATGVGTNLVGGGSASNSFTTIATPSGTSPVADSSTDTLTLAAGTGITITGNATADSVTIGTTGLVSGVGTTKVSYQTTAPSSPVTGDIWIDSDATTTEISPSLYSGYTPGEYYGIKNNGTGNATPTEDVTLYYRIYIPATVTFDRIGCRTGTTFSGTASVRMGIYNHDYSTDKPSTVLLDAGTVSCTALTTTYEITISQTLTQGWYWLAFNVQTAATTNTFLSLTNPDIAGPSSLVRYGSNFQSQDRWQQGSVTGAFATAGTLSSNTQTIAMILRAV